ncbi:hypothetical protein CHS0354_032858 [Potamilus streckersoni]|uniref:Uncharacterized protein n=1 Tax=Potamilus streckersoni TaxID=2493646 RepID=A0AAE0S982_9BIVA|nr:hypothetical protein CHS0354_032858 [Potamilus streckersoni]
MSTLFKNASMMKTSAADRELSDEEDAVKSGSGTGFSGGEQEDDAFKAKPPAPINNKFDPVNSILDKIDAELSSLTRSQSSSGTASTVIHRPSTQSADKDKTQSDDFSVSQLTSSIRSQSPWRSPHFSPNNSQRNGMDTGYGSGILSLRDMIPSDSPRRKTLADSFQNGSFIGHSDEDKHSKLVQNVVTAEASQVDEKFKEIMRKRKGGAEETDKGQSTDAETIRTEDFANKFQETLVYNSGTPPIYPKYTTSLSTPKSGSGRSILRVGTGHTSDADSIRTEDFESRFHDMVVPQTGESDLDGQGEDPIHTRVKLLLQATEKYHHEEAETDKNHVLPTSILKHSSSFLSDKPRPESSKKQHVQISPSPPKSFEDQMDRTELDDTLQSARADGSLRLGKKIETDSVEETRNEIARESEKIRLEMEKERLSKSLSPIRRPRDSRSPTRTMLSLSRSSESSAEFSGSQLSNFHDNKIKKSLSDQEKELKTELQTTHNALEVTKGALVETQRMLQELQAKVEDARSQLMLIEYKKENTKKEVDRLAEDANKKRRLLKEYEAQAHLREEEMKQFNSFGFTKEEAMQIIEESKSMKNRLRNLDALQLERDELIRQLETSKQELFQEQKHARTKMEELQEEVENVTNQMEQLQSEKDEATKQLKKVESAFRKMEKAKNEIIQETTKLYEEEKDKTRQERMETRKQSNREVEVLREEVLQLSQRLNELQDEHTEMEDMGIKLRNELHEAQQQTARERSARDSLIEEHKRTLQTLRKEMDAAMLQLQERLFLEKQQAIEQLRHELDQERREMAAKIEEKLSQQVADHSHVIRAKNEEIERLQKLVDRLEREKQKQEERFKEELKMEVHEAVNREHQAMQSERDWQIQQEKENLEIENRQKLKQLKDELEQEKKMKDSLETKLKEQREQLEDSRAQNKQGVHDKLIAVARAKELMRQEHLSDIDRIKETMKQEHMKELEKMHEKIRIQEEELHQLRAERASRLRAERDTLDHTERTLVDEVNEECLRTAAVLGISPRKVHLPSYRADNGYVPVNTFNGTKPMRITPTIAALDSAVENLKKQMEKEKNEELDRLKKKLAKSMSTNKYHSNLYMPDNDVASLHHGYQYKYHPQSIRQTDYQQREIERLEREINKLAMNQSKMMEKHVNINDDTNYTKSLQHLQAKVKQLQDENNALRRTKSATFSSSVPDLSKPSLYSSANRRVMTPTRDQERMASALSHKLNEAHENSATMEEQQRRSRNVMSKKMVEMSKLQNELTNQAQELIHLEKAYTQLNNSLPPKPPTYI